jgi:uncharacterized membrane protein (UPF0127 family)
MSSARAKRRGGARRSRTRRAVAGLALLLFGCRDGSGTSEAEGRLPVASILVGTQVVTAEIAATPGSRRRGLMFRESLPEDHGMLFIFPDEQPRSFWMKDTGLPLSIAFARSDGTIVSIADLEPYSRRVVSSRLPALYALEMSRGWFARHGVLQGDLLRRLPDVDVE